MSETKELIDAVVRALKGQYGERIVEVSTAEEVVSHHPAYMIKDLCILLKFEKITGPDFIAEENRTAEVVVLSKIHIIEGQEFTKTITARLGSFEERLPRYIDTLMKV